MREYAVAHIRQQNVILAIVPLEDAFHYRTPAQQNQTMRALQSAWTSTGKMVQWLQCGIRLTGVWDSLHATTGGRSSKALTWVLSVRTSTTSSLVIGSQSAQRCRVARRNEGRVTPRSPGR